MPEHKWQILSTNLEGRPQSLYLIFGEPSRCKETLRWPPAHNTISHLLIDVDDNDYPIAMQAVDDFKNLGVSDKEASAAPVDLDRMVQQLQLRAAMLVAFRRAEEEALGIALIRDATAKVREVACRRRSEVACA